MKFVIRESSSDFESLLKDALTDRGILGAGYRMKIVSREIIGRSDWAWVVVDIYPPRKQKPTLQWTLSYNFVKGQIHWDHSSFEWLNGSGRYV